MDTQGFSADLASGWHLTVSLVDGETVAWLVNDQIENGFWEGLMPNATMIQLAEIGYVASVYHEGADGPPLVIFHNARPEAPRYVWVPRQGTFGRAGKIGNHA
jgi:hypothetical protein